MTIVGVGKAVPSQMYLMQLAGLVISGRRKVSNPSASEVDRSKTEGLAALRRMTGQDFGYDVDKWYAYLITNDYGLTHPYGYRAMRRFLKGAGYKAPSKGTAELSKLVRRPIRTDVKPKE